MGVFGEVYREIGRVRADKSGMIADRKPWPNRRASILRSTMSISPEKPQDEQTERRPAEAGVLARFVGKTVVVTGASDQGIGGAVAERLAREGASVALLSRSEPKRLLKRLNRLGAACCGRRAT